MRLFCRCASKYLSTSLSRRIVKYYHDFLDKSRTIAACMPEAAGFEGVRDHSGLYEFSVTQPERFWDVLARRRLSWMSPFHTVQHCDLARGKINWFEGGKLNVSVNCLDRHVHTFPDRVALIWERDEPGSEVKVTYRQLLELTCRLGNLLRRRGVRRGDCVTIYMPPCPLAVVSMLACARIGAAHNVVFAGFSAEALADRIRDAQSSVVITANQGVRGGKVTELKKIVDLAIQSCPAVQQVFVAMRTENPVVMTARDVAMEEVREQKANWNMIKLLKPSVEDCGGTGQLPGVNVCNCMNVTQGIAGTEQLSSVNFPQINKD